MPKGQVSKIRQRLAQYFKKISCQVCEGYSGIDVEPDCSGSKRPNALTTSLFGVAIDQGCDCRFANTANACQHNGCDIRLGQFCENILNDFFTLLDSSSSGRGGHAHNTSINRVIERPRLGSMSMDCWRHVYNNFLRRY